jgi:hypothetical protein
MAIQRRGIANPTDGFSAVFSWLFWLGLLAAGGYGVFWIIGTLQKKTEIEAERNAPVSSSLYKKKVAASEGKRQEGPAFVERKAKPDVDRAAAELNLHILAKEAARLREDAGAQMEHARALAGSRQRFQLLAAGESVVPEVLEGNDEVLGIDEFDFSKMTATEASNRISRSIASIPPGTFLRVRVRRGNERDVLLYFGAATGTGSAFAQRGYVKITLAFAAEIKDHILSLPSPQLSDAERAQIEKWLGAGECTEEQYAMLSERLSNTKIAAGTVVRRTESFTRQIDRLKSFLPKAPVPEAILLKDGRRFTGKLLQDTPGAVSVRTVVGDITVAKEDVERLITADDVRAEFQGKYGMGEKFDDALNLLLTWCQEMNMPVHRELVAYTILQKKPQDPFARGAAGYVQMDGQWVLKSSIAAGAPIPERKVESRDDVRRELEGMGFVLRGQRWYSKVAWSTGIQSLWKPATLKSSLNGTVVMDWHEADTPLYRKDDKPKGLGAIDVKFIAPTGAQGLATIGVDAGAEIVECEVRACAALVDPPPGARVECFVTPEGAASQVLYDISKGSNYEFHDITKFVRGKQKFTVTARIQTVMDKYHTYARYLPSNKDSTQVFWAKGIVLKPAAEFDRVWANAK